MCYARLGNAIDVHVILASCVMLGRCRRLLRRRQKSRGSDEARQTVGGDQKGGGRTAWHSPSVLTSQSLNFTITVTNQPTGKVVGLLHSHERW